MSQQDAKQAGSSADALQQTRALRDTLAASQDPKFKQSKFLQFVSKMSRGEIILEDNQVSRMLLLPALDDGTKRIFFAWSQSFRHTSNI